jgi:hypothetical protein
MDPSTKRLWPVAAAAEYPRGERGGRLFSGDEGPPPGQGDGMVWICSWDCVWRDISCGHVRSKKVGGVELIVGEDIPALR